MERIVTFLEEPKKMTDKDLAAAVSAQLSVSTTWLPCCCHLQVFCCCCLTHLLPVAHGT